ncbi:MAG: PhzF family phenazine biosynthesis protein [Chitinophagaceae bacterium]|nr:MAG: PhzF family phenazine biosynthesis protein [Chitinophagaceae bacterium]
MNLSIYQVDAFADKLFSGNPAAVIPLEKWLDDKLLQQIAMENNLAETVYFIPSTANEYDFEIRWFTPTLEINLCGHATLASAYILYNFLVFQKAEIKFQSKSGLLTVKKEGDLLQLDFPSWKPEPVLEEMKLLQQALGNVEIISVHKYRDLVIELKDKKTVQECLPDFTLLKKVKDFVIITAPGTNGVDFVSRFFAPVAGIDEDPVTGSAHSQLIPFWAEKLNKTKMVAQQLSARGGTLFCELNGDRVNIGGQCKFYMKGEIELS